MQLIPVTQNNSPEYLSLLNKSCEARYTKYQDDGNPYQTTQEQVTETLNQDGHHLYLFEEGDSFIGGVMVIIIDEHTAKIGPFFISPDFSGNGFGSEALLRTEAEFPDILTWKLETIAQEDNLVRFYERLEYRKTGKILPIQEGMDEVTLEKHIKQEALRISTDRLLIREVKLDDFNDYKEIVQNPLTTRWRIHGYDRPMTELEARWTFFIDIFYPKGTWSYALEEKASGKLIGIVSLYDEKPIPGYSIGYTINHEFWNKGYATEINEALVHYVFDETDKEYVSAECATGNIASRRVLEKSLLKFEGVSRYSDYIQGRPVDEAIYGLTRSEYESL